MANRMFDTNIVSFMFNHHTLEAVYQKHLNGYQLALSFMTVGELLEGAVRRNWGPAKRARLDRLLSGFLVIHSNDAVCEDWADIRAARWRQPIGVADAWIAATARTYGMELVTHNPADFANIPGLVVITEAP